METTDDSENWRKLDMSAPENSNCVACPHCKTWITTEYIRRTETSEEAWSKGFKNGLLIYHDRWLSLSVEVNSIRATLDNILNKFQEGKFHGDR